MSIESLMSRAALSSRTMGYEAKAMSVQIQLGPSFKVAFSTTLTLSADSRLRPTPYVQRSVGALASKAGTIGLNTSCH